MWSGWSDFVTGQFVTNVITPILVALATAIIANAIAQKKEARIRSNNALLEEVKRLVLLVKELSDRAAIEVEAQFLGNPTGSFKNSLQQIGSHTKGIAIQIETLKIYLPPDISTNLENANYKWYNELVAEPYPIQKKADALQAHDPRFKQIQDAKVEWQKHLSKLVTNCTTGKVNLNTD